MEIVLPPTTPQTEVSRRFLQYMADRMGVSYAKYGPIAEGFPGRVDAIASLEKRLEMYKQTGNTEWLIDVANFAMIEFLRPRHPQAHYRPTESHESPGRKWHGEVNLNPLPNDIRKHTK